MFLTRRRPQTTTFTESIALEAVERVLSQAAIIEAARDARHLHAAPSPPVPR
jgi:hypothetical protein